MRVSSCCVLATVLALAGCVGGGHRTQQPPPPGTGPYVEMGIDWTMPDRFGLDLNGNGIPDLPNSCGYVHGRLDYEPSYSCVREAEFPVKLQGTAKVKLQEDGRTVGERALKDRVDQWVINGPNGFSRTVDDATPGDGVSTLLPEGKYQVTLNIHGTHGLESASIEGTGTREVTVQDILIVSLGDSYASGEGNPERKDDITIHGGKMEATWADDGRPAARLGTPGMTGVDHYRSHRSTLSAPAQAAMAIERSDPRTSVTFVSLAQSGATIGKGILSPYDGREGSLANLPRSQRSQLELAKSLVGRRGIEFLLISIGGNDIGFGNVGASLVLANSKGDREDIEKAVKTGVWNDVDGNWHDLTGFIDYGNNWVGLDGLPGQYRNLSDRLKETFTVDGRYNVGSTLITTYANPTMIKRNGRLEYCSEVLSGIMPGSAVDTEELKFANEKVLTPLNRAVADAGKAYGWQPIYLEAGHGLCGELPYAIDDYKGNPYPGEIEPWPTDDLNRWFRNAKESSAIQGGERHTTSGTLHPNEFGCRYVGEALSANMLATLKTVDFLALLGAG